MRSAGSGGTNNGRNCRTRSFNTVNDRVQPIRSAITGVGIDGHCASNDRICGSNASTNEPRGPRSRRGGSTARTAERTVFRDNPNRRASSLIGTPSARCNRRISAHSSNLITPPHLRRGVNSNPPPEGQSQAAVDREHRFSQLTCESRSAA